MPSNGREGISHAGRTNGTPGFPEPAGNRLAAGPGINVIWGENAQGKTNLLEALWLFTGSKSFRGARDRELIALSRTEAQLNLAFYAEDRRQEAAIKIGSRRTAELNGIPQSSASSLAGHFCGVVFSPAHLTLIKGGPEERRRFVDAAYCQLRPGYLGGLREYMRALAQRNNLLKDCRGHGDLAMMLDVWDQRLAMAGARLLRARSAYIGAGSSRRQSKFTAACRRGKRLSMSGTGQPGKDWMPSSDRMIRPWRRLYTSFLEETGMRISRPGSRRPVPTGMTWRWRSPACRPEYTDPRASSVRPFLRSSSRRRRSCVP